MQKKWWLNSLERKYPPQWNSPMQKDALQIVITADNLLDTQDERPFFQVKGREGVLRLIEVACRNSTLYREENE